MCRDSPLKNPETIFYLDVKWQGFNKTFEDKGLNVDYFDDKLVIERTTFNLIKDNSNKLLGLWIENDVNIMYLMDSLTGAQYSFVGSEVDIKFDYLFTNDNTKDLSDYDINAKKVIYLKNGIDKDSEILSNYDKFEIRL